MLNSFRQAVSLIEAGARARWLLLLVLAVLVGAAEIVGAFLIFVLLGLITSADAPLELPLVGDLAARFPEASRAALVTGVAVVVGSFFVVRGILYLAQSYLQNRVAHNAGVRLSSRLFRGYLHMPYEAHLRRNSSELIRTAFGSVGEIVDSVLVPAIAVIAETLLVLGVFTALLIVAPEVTLFTAATVMLLVVVLFKVVQPKMRRLGALRQETVNVSLQVLQQSLEGIRDIKLLGREPYFVRQYAQSRATAARTSYLRSVLLDAPRAVIESALMLFIVSFLVISVRGTGDPEESLALLGLFAYAVLRILPSVNRIVANVNNMRFGSAAVGLVLADLAAVDAEDRAPQRTAGAPLRFASLELTDLSYKYDPQGPWVLKGLDLTVTRGESIGVVGATGAGKSTLLDLILGLLTPTAGQVVVNGIEIQSDLPNWHATVGVVSQSVFLVDDTLVRNIALGEPNNEIDLNRVWTSLRIAQLEAFVLSLEEGLATVVGERGVRLSGGQRQRIAIARALYRLPAVLVFDEGTSALDGVTEKAFTDALAAMGSATTVISVAHRLATVRNHDRIIVLEGGSIADVGSYDDLQSRSSLFRRMAHGA